MARDVDAPPDAVWHVSRAGPTQVVDEIRALLARR